MAGEERQTARLLARKPNLEDRAAYHAHFTHPAIERWLRPPPLPPFEARVLDELVEGDCAHWSDHGFGPWVLIEKESGEFAGRGGLAWTSVEGTARVELPWSIEPRLHGRGLATEAAKAAVDWARELRFEEVVALILPSNLASRRVAEKAGFTADGEAIHAGLPHLLFRLRPVD
ncbi:MAG TPA: GNAT family N-acetyltransferase [Solirubrobacterales bacterium]|nr:GNAT family N-acetyltransferase [Solirubrobacterales bacterium]